MCTIKKINERNKNNPDRKEYMRDYHFRRNYGLTAEQYDSMVESRGGLCDICHSAPTGKFPLVVDHNKTSEKIRGLLCNRCNREMGRFEDDPNLLLSAALYLISRDELKSVDEELLGKLKDI